MKRLLITFGDSKYAGSIERLKRTAIEIGKVDEAISYGPGDFSQDFIDKNRRVLGAPRGAGYWVWKPYIIREAFKNLEEGDVILYSDAGLNVIDDLTSLFDVAKDSIDQRVLFRLPAHGEGVIDHKARKWTKRDCFVLMHCDTPKYWGADMMNGAISLWVKNDENIALLNEWSEYMEDPRIVTDDANLAGMSNFAGFEEHRHDQSVLTMLGIKYNFEMFRDPTQFGEMDLDKYINSPYGILFDHHRQKQ
jgi:hypothetical protein